MPEKENGANAAAMIPYEMVPPNVTLTFEDYNEGGGKDRYNIAVPAEDAVWRDVLIRAAFLKKGPMRTETFATCVCVVRYADAMGLNEVLGDLYIVNGKIATTSDAKIRHAMGSGLIAGYKIDITKSATPVGFDYVKKGVKYTFSTKDMHCKVTVKVKGWDEPVVYEADLKEWFNGANAAWTERTEYMFRKNCLSKALAEVAPMGIDAEDIPAPAIPTALDKALDKIAASASASGASKAVVEGVEVG